MILSIPDILSAEALMQAHKLLQDAPWGDGRMSAGSQSARVKSNEQLPFDCVASRAIQSMVLDGLENSNTFFSAVLPHRIYTPRINRYAANQHFYGQHVDGAIRRNLQTGEYVRTDVSCTVFLSEPDSYEGGELQIYQSGQSEAAHSIKLPAGSAIIYTGDTVHEVRPVTRGVRLAAFFWIQSLVRCPVQRELLFDLDNNITAMRERAPDTPELTPLTGTYHNLLRMWSPT